VATGKLITSILKDHSPFIFIFKKSKQSSCARRCRNVIEMRMIYVASQWEH